MPVALGTQNRPSWNAFDVSTLGRAMPIRACDTWARFAGATRDTRNAPATQIADFLVGQLVKDAIFGIEFVGDAVEFP